MAFNLNKFTVKAQETIQDAIIIPQIFHVLIYRSYKTTTTRLLNPNIFLLQCCRISRDFLFL